MSGYISFEGIDVYNRIPAKLYLISVASLLKKPSPFVYVHRRDAPIMKIADY